MNKQQIPPRLLHMEDLEDGRLLEGDSGNPPTPPEDFDLAKFHRGRYFFREHIFSCSFAMFFSLIVGMCFPSLLGALVFTGNSNTPKKALKRYLQTFHHMALWHYGNVWQRGSEANKSLLHVRELHKSVSLKMNENKNNCHKSLSQYDMGMVQSGFMGSILLYSKKFGIKCSDSELDDYVYFWYGIGHLLGIEKRYNICAHGTAQAFLFCKEIDGFCRKNLQNPPAEFPTMVMAVIQAFSHSSIFTLFSLPVMADFLFEAMSKQHKKLSFSDTIRFYVWKLIFGLLLHFASFRYLLRVITEKIFSLTFTPDLK